MGSPDDDRPALIRRLGDTHLRTPRELGAARVNWTLRLDPPTLQRRVTFTPRDFYQDGSAYLKLWSPATVDPSLDPPQALMPDRGRGALELFFRTAEDTAYVVECLCSGLDRVELHLTVAGDNASIRKQVRDGRFNHAFAPHPAGTQVRMMIAARVRWTWYELSIEPRTRR